MLIFIYEISLIYLIYLLIIYYFYFIIILGLSLVINKKILIFLDFSNFES